MPTDSDDDMMSGAPDEIWCPAALDVADIHTLMMGIAGKQLQPFDEGRLSGALSRTQWEIHYRPDQELTLFEVAARIGACIAIAHAFNDAYKRTALYTLSIFLWRNNWSVTADDLVAAFAIESIVIAEQRGSTAILAFQIERLASYLSDVAQPRR